MDIVLGVSMAPPSVHMVLVEGETAGGVTVDQDDFDADANGGTLSGQVVSAILGTRESAREGGYRLTSTGVTVGNQLEAGQLRDALADRRVENVMLVSAFLAAAALAQKVGGSVGYARTALMFIEPDSATLAVVDSADGSITEVHRVTLPADDAPAVAELTAMAAQAGQLSSHPDGMFVVGSGVNVGMIKAELEAVSLLPVNVPEEPETALARGAALASAHAPLFDSSTSALAWARDPGTGMIDPNLVALGYAYMPGYAYIPGGSNDYDATMGEQALAYSADDDDADSGYLTAPDGEVAEVVSEFEDSSGLGLFDGETAVEDRGRKPFLLAGSGLAAFFVVAVSGLAVALAISIRPTAESHPAPSQHIVVPTQQAPAPQVQLPPPPPPAPAAPAPSALPASPPQSVQLPAPVGRQAPAAPAPIPAAPAPAPVQVAPAPIPIPIPIPIQVPAPVAPAPALPPASAPKPPQLPQLPSFFNPPAQSPPKNGGGFPGGGDSGGQRGQAPSPWFPGLGGGGDRGGGSPWFPGLGGGGGGGGGHDGGRGGGSPWFPGLGGGGGHGGFGGGGGHGGFGDGGRGGGGGGGGGFGGGHGGGFHF